ncbi:cobaltochelatase subunit CobN [Aquamicrobium sp. LC103]|uniref:cobaltochelatase subunit CobN n=1 Tax=Aquamicrobium sp. LC103 TaxID=1120658 RepID=UPI00063E8C21|nr:cobaltochelatase subunit CobN [Aquamicrobium sp. LC103]TKT76699.1 cobaltochelatase subunit CobN [Aquamicrobium sp. LC103]
MHLLATTSATLDDLVEPVDLRQEPADMVALSFTDSDLAGLAAAWKAEGALPSMRLAALRDLRHPMSVDLWLDGVAAHAKVILVRLLGGYEWWRYGCDRLSALARERGIRLALLPGEGREADERLAALSTLPREELERLLAFFREGGPENMAGLLQRLATHAGGGGEPGEARALPQAGFHDPNGGVVDLDAIAAAIPTGAPVVPILFYRSMLLAADAAPIDALAAALRRRGLFATPIFVSSLKDEAVARFVEDAAAHLSPAAIVAATAFASAADGEGRTLFDRIGVPVMQAVTATTRREAWERGQRGLAPADLAMHVVLPELDGRILAGAISFKAESEVDRALGFRGQTNASEADRVEQVADRVVALVALQRSPRAERNIAILMPDYPGAPGRAGYAVGLDVPASVIAMLYDLREADYGIENVPETPRALLRLLERGEEGISASAYHERFGELPDSAKAAVTDAWGELPAGEFRFRAARFGKVTVALAPDRGRSEDRRADYHDPSLPPRHELLAFGFWLRHTLASHAIIHVGAHGTLEWLPGKTVALSQSCFPEIVTGPLPVVYPFIVSNPGEAAQAKRRIGAVTLGHLPPPLVGAGLDEDQQALERLVDEYAQAEGLDRRRRERLAPLIVETARRSSLAGEAGVAEQQSAEEALVRIDAWLCDLKDMAIKDGLHVFGRAQAEEADAARIESAAAERKALLDALDARHVAAGPAGAPARGRLDVLPTGRNLFAADPRTMPTPTAFELGRLAADEVLRRHLQDHGDWPRSLVLDLWGSASLRTGGEEIAQGLALMGCRPQWDAATGRVTGIEVLPTASVGRPRIDVTFRISGLFRDMFPTQIALIDAAVAAVAAREELPGENSLAEETRRTGKRAQRIFGTSPGTYGAGIEELLQDGRWKEREELGRAFLDATSHAYGGADGEGEAAPGAFAARIGAADLLVHAGDDPGRDILEGSADVAFIGGFAAAAAALGRNADLIALDTTDPQRPRARSVAEAVARVVRARAVNPRFIEGQLRHGPRGASEFAETVDRLVGFAETTNAIPAALIEAVHDAYLGDERVRAFLLDQNPAAARAIAQRFADARRRGLWQPLRNSVDNDLAELIAEAGQREAA